LVVAAGVLWALVPGIAPASTPVAPETPSLKVLTVAFKLDPRLTGGTYGGERWVSPPKYTTAGEEADVATVEVRIHGLDAD
jgi:hypothetical protein